MEVRKKQILLGFGVIFFFFCCLAGGAGAAYLSGFAGEFGRLCLALVTSPFLMEGSIFFLALILLFGVNAWHRMKVGTDYFHLDEDGFPVRKKSV